MAHASTSNAASVDVDLSAYTVGFSAGSPTYAVSGAQNGTVALQPDKHTARFQPAASYRGPAAFTFTVSGSDGAAFSQDVSVLVTP